MDPNREYHMQAALEMPKPPVTFADSKVQEFFDSLEAGYWLRHDRPDLSPNPKLAEKERLNMILFDAVCYSDHERISRAIALGANVNYVDIDLGVTPLHIAIGRKNKMIFERLIAAGARPDTEAKNGRTALDEAWRNARLELNTHFAEFAERSWRETNPRAVTELTWRFQL